MWVTPNNFILDGFNFVNVIEFNFNIVSNYYFCYLLYAIQVLY